jgi:hypothetical protein
MKTVYRALILVFFLLTEVCFAQKVTNITAEQVGQTIQVSYKLETESPCAISLFYSTNNGVIWHGPLKKVSRDVGEEIDNGNKKITWYVLNELEQFKYSSVVFKIEAVVDITNTKVQSKIEVALAREANIKAQKDSLADILRKQQQMNTQYVSTNESDKRTKKNNTDVSQFKVDFRMQIIPEGISEESFKESNRSIFRTIINTANNQNYYLKVVYDYGLEQYYKGSSTSAVLINITSSLYYNEVWYFRKALK